MSDHRTGPETERLLHRAMEPRDAASFFALNSHPEVIRYTGEEPLASVEEARERIENNEDFETVGFGRWGSFLKETGEMIGFCGLKYLPELEEVDIGYRFLPEYWGRGLATEAGKATLDYGFQEIGLEEIIGLVLDDNAGSIRVLEKLGFQAAGRVMYDEFDCLRFTIRP